MSSRDKRPFYVLYEDNHLLIVNKAAGVLVQGDHTKDKPLVELCRDYVRDKYNKPGNVFMGLVHRLDRPVSGIVVLAKTSKGLERMSKLFHDRKVQKTYWAITKHKPRFPGSSRDHGTLINWLRKDGSKNLVTAYQEETEGAQKAELSYRVLGKLNDHFLLEIKPKTGRPHQIRAQLGAVKTPIKGDLKYGFTSANVDKSINLHARKLYFQHPIKKEPVEIIAPLPETDFWEQYLVLEQIKVKSKDLDIKY
ncbi:MAG: RluA family pseudouridine synthase [Cyclobacteriaceae bacterium]|nr:RluA family pseudouridine synthase [Cyclobacteriaceae bacterium]